MTLPDGSSVNLDSVRVGKIRAEQNPGYIVIYESFQASDRLIVLTQPSMNLQLGQTVDVAGTMITLPNGYRAVANPTVQGYVDRNGLLMLQGGILKGPASPIIWPWKTEIAPDTVQETSANVYVPPTPDTEENSWYCPTISGMIEALTPDETPNSLNEDQRLQSYYSDITEIQTLSDDALVELTCKGISAVGNEIIGGINYKYADIIDDAPANGSIRAYYTRDLTANQRVNLITGQIQHVGTTPVICVDTGPNYKPTLRVGKLVAATPGTISYAKTLANGVSVILSGVVVAANKNDFPGATYVQEQDRSSGIRVRYSGTLRNRGNIVNVSGTMALGADWEREITGAVISYAGTGQSPKPIGMSSGLLGGSAYNTYTPGITNPANSVAGLNNKGLLVTTFGKITHKDVSGKFFYIDDGKGLEDGSGYKGVKVSWAWSPDKPSISAPLEDSIGCVTGISGSEAIGAGCRRVLRPRSQSDIVLQYGEIPSPMTISITSPKSGLVTMPYGGQAEITGTANAPDLDDVIVEVMVSRQSWNSGWCQANLDTITGSWSVDGNLIPYNGNQTVAARIKDAAQNIVSTQTQIDVNHRYVINVKSYGSDINDGLSWQYPKNTIAGALAVTYPGSYDIWVSADTYQENPEIAREVELYGGFLGDEWYREQRDFSGNQTIIDGSEEESPAVLVANSTGVSRIDGFTITGGSGNRVEEPEMPIFSKGGGIYCNSLSTVHIVNNRIKQNTIPYGVVGEGAGIYAEHCSNLMVCNNFIIANSIVQTDGIGTGISLLDCSGQVVGNTFAHNTGATSVSYYDSPIIFANNVVAFNSAGIGNTGAGSHTIINNCIYSNAGGNFGTLGTKAMLVDPLFSTDYHLSEMSPLRDAADMTYVDTEALDIDGQPRVQDFAADIGADETEGCGRVDLTITTETPIFTLGAPRRFIVHVSGSSGALPNRLVEFSLTGGTLEYITNSANEPGQVDANGTSGRGTTDSNGDLYVYVSRETAGNVTLTAAMDEPCGLDLQKGRTVEFDKLVEIFFCIDVTGSMSPDEDGDHRAKESVIDFLNDMVSAGVSLRVGGVKFNDTNAQGVDFIDTQQLRSLSVFTNMNEFMSSWANNDYGTDGGNAPELQLDALNLAASDMNAHSTPGNPDRYIILITDNVFHYSGDGHVNCTTLTKTGMINELQSSGCRVYLSLWDPDDALGLSDEYEGLLVNGGVFDPPNDSVGPPTVPMSGKYPLVNFRAQVLAETP